MVGGACVAGACTAGETAAAAGGTYPTGMHSCFPIAVDYLDTRNLILQSTNLRSDLRLETIICVQFSYVSF